MNPARLHPAAFCVITLTTGILRLAAAEVPTAGTPSQDVHAAHAAHATATAPATSAAPTPSQPLAADFIRLDPSAPKTVEISLVSAYNDANYGMNFDGFAKGRARLVVPKGWTVKAVFRNQSPVPHSAIVVELPTVKKLQMGPPAFKGASTPDPVKGSTGGELRFSFVADEAGDFAIACGFPGHAANGHWIALDISETATEPTLKFGDAPPYTPK